jgi:peptide/nickel transport system ATP-binding protein
VVRGISDRVMVMYGGRVCEVLDADDLLTATHPYTVQLLASVPSLDAVSSGWAQSRP